MLKGAGEEGERGWDKGEGVGKINGLMGSKGGMNKVSREGRVGKEMGFTCTGSGVIYTSTNDCNEMLGS
jgi:hypothetical protein